MKQNEKCKYIRNIQVCNTQAPQGQIGPGFQITHLSVRLSLGDQDGDNGKPYLWWPHRIKRIWEVKRSYSWTLAPIPFIRRHPDSVGTVKIQWSVSWTSGGPPSVRWTVLIVTGFFLCWAVSCSQWPSFFYWPHTEGMCSVLCSDPSPVGTLSVVSTYYYIGFLGLP